MHIKSTMRALEGLYGMVKYSELFFSIMETISKLELYYGVGNLQYIFEYCGMDEEETEVVTAFIAGKVFTTFTATCTKDKKVSIE